MCREHTTETGKAMRMKYSCIIPACPEGAWKSHIQIFAMFYIAKKPLKKSVCRSRALCLSEQQKSAAKLTFMNTALSSIISFMLPRVID